MFVENTVPSGPLPVYIMIVRKQAPITVFAVVNHYLNQAKNMIQEVVGPAFGNLLMMIVLLNIMITLMECIV